MRKVLIVTVLGGLFLFLLAAAAIPATLEARVYSVFPVGESGGPGSVTYTQPLRLLMFRNPTPAPGAETVLLHRVAQGQTLYGIARSYGIPLSRLLAANNLRSSVIYPGQILRVPLPGKTPASPNPPAPVPQTPAPPPAPAPAVPVSPAPPPPPAPVTPTTPGVLKAAEARLLELVNQERARAGVPPLTLHTRLSEVARLKSEDMARHHYFAHQSPTYGSPFEMMRSFGIRYIMAGENLALSGSADRAHSALMNSPAHRGNILNARYTHIGIGMAAGSRGQYYTQMFIQAR
jgi:uncharacterized YkwD family protein